MWDQRPDQFSGSIIRQEISQIFQRCNLLSTIPPAFSPLPGLSNPGTEDMSPGLTVEHGQSLNSPRMRQCQQKRTQPRYRQSAAAHPPARARRSDAPMSPERQHREFPEHRSRVPGPARGPALTACDSGTVLNISWDVCCEDSVRGVERHPLAQDTGGTTHTDGTDFQSLGMQTGGSYFFFCCAPWGSRFPREGLDPGPQQGNQAVLTTTPPGNFPEALISNIYFNRKPRNSIY